MKNPPDTLYQSMPMTNEIRQQEVIQIINSTLCKRLSDETSCLLHQKALNLITTAIKANELSIPTDSYSKYKGCVEISNKILLKIESLKKSKQPNVHLLLQAITEMLYDYRQQMDEALSNLCPLIR